MLLIAGKEYPAQYDMGTVLYFGKRMGLSGFIQAEKEAMEALSLFGKDTEQAMSFDNISKLGAFLYASVERAAEVDGFEPPEVTETEIQLAVLDPENLTRLFGVASENSGDTSSVSNPGKKKTPTHKPGT